MKKDVKAAANDILIASAFLKLESNEAATDEDRAGLEISYNALNNLAAEVEKGAILSEGDLTKRFVIALRALAMHFSVKAEEAWKVRNQKSAGQFLNNAVVNIEYAYKWAGQDMGTGAMAMRVARDLSVRLIEGSVRSHTEVDNTLAAIRTEINGLGKYCELMREKHCA